jgi:ornithine--oxo-acid transaminase
MKRTIDRERQVCARNYEPFPIVLVRGRGVYVWDEEGRRYLDMLGAYSAASLGHSHPRVVKALVRQAETLDTVSRAYFTDRLGPFVERACAMTGMDRGLPMNTGAEAVETAIKAARKWAYRVKGVAEQKAEIIACEGNFHGRTMGATALSTVAQYRDGFGPFPPGFRHVAFGDARALEAAITPDTAAFLVEPIQGEGGIVIPPAGYLAECARICRQANVLLLCDEIQTGLGRTGKLLACDHDGVRPDGLTLGKALGGGLLPVSLFLARREVMDVFTPGDHGSTFGGNPLAAAVGEEVLKIIEEERLSERSAELGGYLLDKLRAIASRLVVEVRGRGLFVGVEFDRDRIAAREVCHAFLRHGIASNSTHRNVVRFAPPLTITREEIDWAVARVAGALAEIEAGPAPSSPDPAREPALQD